MLNTVNVSVQVNGEVQQPLVMTHRKAIITEVGGIAVAENANRKYLLIINNTDTDMIIGLGTEITNDEGIPLNAGANFQISKDYLFTGSVYAMHKSIGEKLLDITEGV